MKIIIIYQGKHHWNVSYTTIHDTSVMNTIPNIKDEITDKSIGGLPLIGLVQRRSFDYIRGIVTIYVKI